jgi:hypothetical protein
MPQDLVDHQDLERAREAAEGVRLAYVAATRARDLLVVPAVGDEPFEEGWVRPLSHAIYPEPLSRRDAQLPEGVGALTFGKDTVVERTDGDPAPGGHGLPRTSPVWTGEQATTSHGGIPAVLASRSSRALACGARS